MSKKQQNVNFSSPNSLKKTNNTTLLVAKTQHGLKITLNYNLEITASVNSAVLAEPPKSPVKRSLSNNVFLMADLI